MWCWRVFALAAGAAQPGIIPGVIDAAAMRALGEPMDPLDPLMDPFAVVETTTPAPTPHDVEIPPGTPPMKAAVWRALGRPGDPLPPPPPPGELNSTQIEELRRINTEWNGNYSDAVVDRVVAELSTPNRTGFLRALAPR